ncbi:hypothetical protein FACS189449_01000 [Alphaproteobacteria bacterium]|nr:hypothetical protein FACS189449_01000 [Alphaproteobacteria bacterium]
MSDVIYKSLCYLVVTCTMLIISGDVEATTNSNQYANSYVSVFVWRDGVDAQNKPMREVLLKKDGAGVLNIPLGAQRDAPDRSTAASNIVKEATAGMYYYSPQNLADGAIFDIERRGGNKCRMFVPRHPAAPIAGTPRCQGFEWYPVTALYCRYLDLGLHHGFQQMLLQPDVVKYFHVLEWGMEQKPNPNLHPFLQQFVAEKYRKK